MGILYVVATPIGNLEDISLRAKRILMETSVIACEDTRHTGNLLKVFNAQYSEPKKYISIRDFNETQMVDKIIFELQTQDVALVSDAGTPLISDPGFKLVRKCHELGIKVVPIPGASAAITALSASGLPTNKFMFLGFLSKKWEIRPEETTIIYESPKRVNQTIQLISEKYPDARIVIAHELTKLYEEIKILSTCPMALDTKGEYTILVYRPKDSDQSYLSEL
jgi:16S rRNA (cytidine1402-2'-O)-methyltransferase